MALSNARSQSCSSLRRPMSPSSDTWKCRPRRALTCLMFSTSSAENDETRRAHLAHALDRVVPQIGVGEDVEQVVAVERAGQLAQRLAVLDGRRRALALVALAIQAVEQLGGVLRDEPDLRGDLAGLGDAGCARLRRSRR